MSTSDAEAAAAAFIISVTASPIIAVACKRFRILDQPGPLKIHNRPIPRLGGVAIAIAIAVGMLVGEHFELHRPLVIAAFFLVWSTGLLDDIRSLTPSARLTSQVVAAFLLWCAGYGLPSAIGGVLSLLGTIVVVVLLANGWNLWDGSDGLAAGIAAIAALAFFFAPDHARDSSAPALAASVAAACSAFLVWNFPPAKLFMGDAGSTLLGFTTAFLTLDFYRSTPASLPAASFPVFVAALPLLDAALAVTRRFRQAQSLVHGDRSHIYDVLLRRGWQSRNVALVFCGLSGVLAGLAWLALSTRQTVFILADAVVVVTVLVTAIGLGSLGPAEKKVRGELDPRKIASSRSAR